jgi:hypothetical protein
VAEYAGAAQGEAGLTVSPWALSGAVPALGRTPALRGFPGGIGVAGPGWPGGLAEEDQTDHGAWPDAADEPVTLAGPGAGRGVPVNGSGSQLAGLPPLPGQGNGSGRGGPRRDRWPAQRSDPALSGRQQPGQTPAAGGAAGQVSAEDEGMSIWQRAVSIWRAAGLDWQRPAGWAFDDADQRTEPIPVVPAADVALVTDVSAPEQPPGADGGPGPDSQGHGPEAGHSAGSGLAGPAAETGAGPETAARAPAGSVLEHSGPAAGERADGGERAAGVAVGGAAAAVETGMGAAPAAAPLPSPAGAEAPEPAAGAAATGAAVAATGSAGDGPQPGAAGPGSGVLEPESVPGMPGGRTRAGRGVLVGAVICVVVIALAIAAIIVIGPGGGTRLTVASQSATLADGQFAGPGGLAEPSVPPVLTGIAAVGRTVVAIGARATLPAAQPLMLTSADGGQTWQRAMLQVPGGAMTGAGAVPLMLAGGQGGWLALATDASWTSTDGHSWRLGPAIAPVIAGDRVLALAPAGTGFLAVGENVQFQGSGVMRSPVLWRTSDGLTWQRESTAQLRLPSGNGRVVALQWVAARGRAVMIAGNVTHLVTRRRGKHRVSVTTQSVMVWLTTNGGRTWVKADPPVSNGATHGLAGLAATGAGLVAIRPGHTAGGVPDAVAYLATHGTAWSYAGQLRALRGGGFTVTAVSGSNDGVVVTGSAGRYRVAFVSLRGRSWRQTAHLAASRATTVAGVTVGPHGNVVAAEAGSNPFLLLARARRIPVGQATLAALAADGVSVNSVGASQGDQVAVGEAGRKPAVWLHSAGGQWVQLTTPSLPSWQGGGPGLASVVHGSAGWLAVGTEGGPGSAAPAGSTGLLTTHAVGGSTQPVLLTSTDGYTWQTQAGQGPAAPPALTLTGAAAGPSGYVVVGLQSIGGRPVPALFWSADLRTWQPEGPGTGYEPASEPAAAPLAVAAGPAGFTAVGGTGVRPAVWLSQTGQDWVMRTLALPPGARGAVLQQVAIQGRRIAALGTEARGSGPAPFAAVSSDAGQTWREYLLPAPAHPATVTALAAAGRGFAATGTVVSPSGGQDVIIWWSADGQNWQLTRSAGSALNGPGAHAITGLAGLHGQVTGVGYAATPAGQHPILWHARIG